MKCHYEVLGVERNASDGDIKKAYRRLALQYHPDKNQDNVEECTRLFTAVQQAYEVLSDPQERAWYDKHREDILYGAGSDFKDESFNLMPYFSATCFTGHGDDKEGFYSVYAEVFQRLIEEEAQYMEDDDEQLPLFGDSTSDYETVVHRFYSYWQSFSTHKSFAWEDEHNLRDAPNRRVQRLMEKENRKLREAAKKKTNDTIRALVGFVRKRDKRVQAYKIVLEEREMLRQQKVAEKRAKDREKRLRLQEEYQADPSHSEAVAQFEEELQSLATQLNDEFGRDSSGSEESVEEDMFCPACNKLFKTDKAFANHQRSKKHRENAALLRKLLQEEEAETQLQKSHNDSDQSDHNIWDQLDGLNLTDPQHTNHVTIDNTAPEDLRTDHHNMNSSASIQSRCDPLGMASTDTDEEPELPVILLQSGAPSASLPEETVQQFSLIKEDVEEAPRTKRKAKGGKKKTVSSCESSGPRSQLNYCHVCNKDFPSRNKLFQHIKDTGHALRIDTEPPKSKKSARRKK